MAAETPERVVLSAWSRWLIVAVSLVMAAIVYSLVADPLVQQGGPSYSVLPLVLTLGFAPFMLFLALRWPFCRVVLMPQRVIDQQIGGTRRIDTRDVVGVAMVPGPKSGLAGSAGLMLRDGSTVALNQLAAYVAGPGSAAEERVRAIGEMYGVPMVADEAAAPAEPPDFLARAHRHKPVTVWLTRRWFWASLGIALVPASLLVAGLIGLSTHHPTPRWPFPILLAALAGLGALATVTVRADAAGLRIVNVLRCEVVPWSQVEDITDDLVIRASGRTIAVDARGPRPGPVTAQRHEANDAVRAWWDRDRPAMHGWTSVRTWWLVAPVYVVADSLLLLLWPG